METVGVRELQLHARAVLRRVRAGERLGVTDRGALVAMLSPPGAVWGTEALVVAGRVRPAIGSVLDVTPRRRPGVTAEDVLGELRADR